MPELGSIDLTVPPPYPNAVRATLAIVLALSGPLNAETTTDPLWYLLSTYVLARDDRAIAAPGEGATESVGLASLQADIQLLADGFESFRDEAQVKETLTRLEPRIAPELRPFFKDRTTSLDTIYRTLAVTDYTWALRFPEPPCAPVEARRKLLDSRDGLFQNEKGGASPWLVSLLGPRAEGKSAEQALDQASSKAKPTAAEYEKRRALVRRLTLALASDRAIGAARSKLYCSRAAAYEDLAAYHSPREKGPILAARSTGRASPEPSVFVVVWNSRRAAATLLETKDGPILLTDASIVEGTDHPKLFAFAGKTKPIELKATVTRRDAGLGLAVLTYSEDLQRPALVLSDKAAVKDDLVSAIGHAEVSGLWTKSSGLVTESGSPTFQTDAAVTADFSGGPVLNEVGEVVGLLVLRPADTEEGRWPVAVPAGAIESWLGGAVRVSAPTAEAIEDAGTAAILNRTHPSSLTETGLGAWNIPNLPPPPPTPQGICVKYCDDAPSRTTQRSRTNYTNPRSSYGGSSHSSNANKELGEALGKLGAELIIQGVPALFRGIGKLFRSSPAKAAPTAKVVRAPKPEPPKPPPPAKCDVVLVAPPTSIGAAPVEVIARVECRGGPAPLAGHRLAFSVQWDSGTVVIAPEVDTDDSGTAVLGLTVSNESTKLFKTIVRSEESHDELDRLSRHHTDEESAAEASSVGDLIETQRTVEVSVENAATPPATALAVAGVSRTSLTLTNSGRRLRVMVKIVRLARVARVVSVAGAPGSGGLTLGISVASTVLIFALERRLERELENVESLEPPGECSDDRHSELHRNQGTRCKGPRRTCDALKRGDCANLRLFLERNRQCVAAEKQIMDECFRGGNAKHKSLHDTTRQLFLNCQKRVEDECN